MDYHNTVATLCGSSIVGAVVGASLTSCECMDHLLVQEVKGVHGVTGDNEGNG